MAVTYVTFMTDFGNRDDSAGCCRGVIVGRAPDVRLVDITHEIPPFDVRRGALTWINVLPYMPVGIHVGVVDPGVGTARRPIAVRVRRGDVLVGPDNGLLPAGAGALGGVSAAVELADERFMLQPRSSTFHGRAPDEPTLGIQPQRQLWLDGLIVLANEDAQGALATLDHEVGATRQAGQAGQRRFGRSLRFWHVSLSFPGAASPAAQHNRRVDFHPIGGGGVTPIDR